MKHDQDVTDFLFTVARDAIELGLHVEFTSDKVTKIDKDNESILHQFNLVIEDAIVIEQKPNLRT